MTALAQQEEVKVEWVAQLWLVLETVLMHWISGRSCSAHDFALFQSVLKTMMW